MKNKWLLIFLYLLPAVFLTGCWDMIDIEKNAFILGIGVDTYNTPQGNAGLVSPLPFAPEKQIQLTLETFSPYLSKNTRGKNTIIIHQDGSTPEESLRLAQAQMSRKLSVVHLRSVIIGDECARQGIRDLMYSLERNPEIANRFRLVVLYKKRAEELLAAPMVSERNVSEIIGKGGELDFAYAFHRTISFNELYELMERNNGTAYTAMLNMDEKKRISNIGAAVFKDWKLIDYLDAYEVRSANWVTGKVDMATVVDVHEESGALGSYVVSSSTGKIKPVLSGDQLSFLVSIKTQGFLAGLESPPPEGVNEALLSRLEHIMAERIKKEAEMIIAKAQKKNQADYLGFGYELNNRYPEIYKSLDWEEVFPNVPVEVKVEAKMTRIGAFR